MRNDLFLYLSTVSVGVIALLVDVAHHDVRRQASSSRLSLNNDTLLVSASFSLTVTSFLCARRTLRNTLDLSLATRVTVAADD